MVEIYKDVIRNHSQTEEAKLTLEQLKKICTKKYPHYKFYKKKRFYIFKEKYWKSGCDNHFWNKV